MRKRWIYIGLFTAVTSAAVAVVVVVARPSHAQSSIAGEITPMQTITPYQLQEMHLFLGAAPASGPAITSSQADQAVQTQGTPNNAGPILETVLATCSMTPQPVSMQLPWANRPCWVVSLKPAPEVVSTPRLYTGSNTVIPTVEYALVDASTGHVFDEAAGTPPPTSP